MKLFQQLKVQEKWTRHKRQFSCFIRVEKFHSNNISSIRYNILLEYDELEYERVLLGVHLIEKQYVHSNRFEYT